MKTKNVLAVAAIIAVSYTVGKCRGIYKIGKAMDKVLKKETNVRVDKVCYDIFRNKVAVDLIVIDEEETKETEETEE